MNEWREFLLEQDVKYQGILKLGLSPENITDVEILQATLPEEAIRLKPDDLHVTLIHQSILKPFRKEIKSVNFPPAPEPILDDDIWERESLGKKSWAVKLVNQDEMRDYVTEVMNILGSQNNNPEPERVFHISLANLTGNPHDSVK
jgi:hypothetical protein